MRGTNFKTPMPHITESRGFRGSRAELSREFFTTRAVNKNFHNTKSFISFHIIRVHFFHVYTIKQTYFKRAFILIVLRITKTEYIFFWGGGDGTHCSHTAFKFFVS